MREMLVMNSGCQTRSKWQLRFIMLFGRIGLVVLLLVSHVVAKNTIPERKVTIPGGLQGIEISGAARLYFRPSKSKRSFGKVGDNIMPMLITLPKNERIRFAISDAELNEREKSDLINFVELYVHNADLLQEIRFAEIQDIGMMNKILMLLRSQKLLSECTFYMCEIGSKTLGTIHHIPSLDTITFYGSSFNCRDLGELGKSTIIGIVFRRSDEQGTIERLGKISQLRSISFVEQKIGLTTSGLNVLNSMPELSELDLVATRCDYEEWDRIRLLKQIKTITLTDMDLSDRRVGIFESWPSARLIISNVKMTQRQYDELRKMTNLKLSGVPVIISE